MCSSVTAEARVATLGEDGWGAAMYGGTGQLSFL